MAAIHALICAVSIFGCSYLSISFLRSGRDGWATLTLGTLLVNVAMLAAKLP